MTGEIFFIKDWYEKGVRQISDLIDEQGNIYKFEVLKTKYHLRGTFLDYQFYFCGKKNPKWLEGYIR